ncbi:PKD domain-containing protein [Panacibacter ginsenosidivorans]|uniref:PKD domain-containing protein n=1 Tax=Panacibacter ginsenosidivorans TaxID=1813871 RepID=A0A5B8V7T8_9BACT|nr:ThuA domain-containing protein [Panacibacter ginsenosidivorans]QEC66881.1 PKD domain-containing protein [Panacibacter ginsenosidivorans]
MKKFLPLIALATIVILATSCSNKRSGNPRVLVFSKTAGFRHGSIPNGQAAIMKLGQENGFDVDTTEDADMFNEDSLKKYAAVIFLSTTGNVLDYKQEAAFERYIQAGGGYMGIHAAADCEYDWGWYGRLVGAYFISHPGINDTFPNVQQGVFNVVDQSMEATKNLPKEWKRTDEFYNFKKISKDIKVLITIDEKSYHGGINGENHPMSWYHDYDGGRAFYTNLGHTQESFSEDLYLKHILGGIQYAIGDNAELDYSKAKTQLPPAEDRFTKTPLVQGEFFEPTEMTILPNFDILVGQRRGEIMLYKNDTKKLKQAGYLKVYWKTDKPGVNAEEGLLGMQKDPHFAQNNWVYIYYSPADSSVNRLSRFTFKNDTIDNATEKVILEVKSQRDICCHTGGSIAFGPDGLLYLSAGDNSTPFDEPGARFVNSGYGPMNDEPGHMQYDARRSSSNTNDLRGKILRIRVKDDGSYEIPDGNLFPKGTEKTRPEIYVMGDRNPYRISVDQKNSYLYWGEVGPDANNDSFDTRGPRGYDELNQARKAGYFGWPLFVGNNYPYRAYNYATGASGPAFDPLKPINDSRNNTGLRELPPVSPAFIWYPYGNSPDFPQVGSGGRNAMAGPVYYTDMFPDSTRMPDYYNGKLFMYDWIRGWIKAVTMLPNGDFDKMEPFMEHIKLNNCIDMEVGPDGRLYLLEYGTGWFSKNPDAGLSRIDYNGGNRAPKVTAINVDKTSGVLPFAVKLKVNAMDPEKDKLTYKWDLGNGTTKETTEPSLDYSYTAAGDFKITVDVKDATGAVTKSDAVDVYAGNEAPQVSIALTSGNRSFYLPGVPINYKITVSDPHDTAKFDPANLFVSVDYAQGFDKAASTMGHQQGAATVSGKNLMLSFDCKSCHKEAETSVGPAFVLVAKKYAKDPNAMSYLTNKIMKGGSGVWGEVAMAAHPTIPQNDLQQIVTWILSLANKDAAKKSLPAEGTITPVANQKPNTVLVLSASYTDKGGNNIKALTGSNSIALAGSTVAFKGTEKTQGFTTMAYNGMNIMLIPAGGGWFAVDSIDLSGVRSVTLTAGWQEAPKFGFDFEVRLDAPAGKVIGTGSLLPPQGKVQFGMVHIGVEAVTDGKFHTVYITCKPKNAAEKAQAGIMNMQFGAK